MDEHGLIDWRFRWSHAKRQLGACTYAARTIALSGHYVQMNDEAHIRDTILHEIAHALAGERAGHGPAWKAVCRRIGADPSRLDHTAKVPDAPYELFCPLCRTVVAPRHRRVRPKMLRRLGCRRCGDPSFGKLQFRLATEPG